MNVASWMNRHVRSASPDDSLLKAWRTMVVYRIRHLPVMEGDTLRGILSDRDIKRHALPVESEESVLLRQEHLDAIPVHRVMVRDVVTATPTMPMERAAGLMAARRIDSLPVMEDGRLVGLVTSTDIMNFFASHLGTTDSQRLVDVAVHDEYDGLQRVMDTLRGIRRDVPNLLVKRDSARGSSVLTVTLSEGDAQRLTRELGEELVQVEGP